MNIREKERKTQKAGGKDLLTKLQIKYETIKRNASKAKNKFKRKMFR